MVKQILRPIEASEDIVIEICFILKNLIEEQGFCFTIGKLVFVVGIVEYFTIVWNSYLALLRASTVGFPV